MPVSTIALNGNTCCLPQILDSGLGNFGIANWQEVAGNGWKEQEAL